MTKWGLDPGPEFTPVNSEPRKAVGVIELESTGTAEAFLAERTQN